MSLFEILYKLECLRLARFCTYILKADIKCYISLSILSKNICLHFSNIILFKEKNHFSNRFTGETILVVSLPMVTPHWVTLEDTFENLVVPRVHTSVYKWIPAPGTSQGVNQSYKQGQHCCSDRPDSTGLFFKNILLFAVIGHHNTLCGGRPQHFCCNREDICGLRSQQFVVARGHNTTTFTERLFGAWSFHNSALMKV